MTEGLYLSCLRALHYSLSVQMYDIHELSKTYEIGKVRIKALDCVSLHVNDGDIASIMGRSGSGKSTLLRQLGLLDRPTTGTAFLDGVEVTKLPETERSRLRLKYIGYVFQEYALLGELTAIQNVFLPGMMLGRNSFDYRKRAIALLETVGLGARINHYPKEMSGGEQQRVAIARAMINGPKLLLADEPCANLDTTSARLVMETLVRLNRELNLTIVFVSHDPADKQYSGRVITLSDGRIVDQE